MAELTIFCVIGTALILTHIGAVIIYKIKTKSKKSVWELMDEL